MTPHKMDIKKMYLGFILFSLLPVLLVNLVSKKSIPTAFLIKSSF
jgi:hypothetical protein